MASVGEDPRVLRRSMTVWAPGVVLHFLLGVYRLNRYDLLNDEVFSLSATQNLGETLDRTHGTMALYYVALEPFAWVSHAAAWIRLPSLIFSCVAVGLIGVFVGRQAGPSAGRLAAILAALSYPVIEFSVIARSYAMWLAAVAFAWYLLDRMLEDASNQRLYLGFAGAVVLMPLIHGMAVIGIVGLGLAILWSRPDRQQLLRLLTPCAAAIALTVVLYLCGAREVGVSDSSLSIATTRLFLRGLVFPGVRVSIAFLALAAFGGWRLAHKRAVSPLERFRRIALLIWGPLTVLATFVVLCSVQQSIIARYTFPSSLALAGLLAVAVTPSIHPQPATSGTRGRVRMPWATAATSLVTVMALGLTELPQPNHQWTATVDIVRSNSEPGDAIIFVPPVARLGYEAADTSESHAPALAGPGKPLGTFDRFGGDEDMWRTIDDIKQPRRLWIVVANNGPDLRTASELLSRTPIAHRYDRTGQWRPGPDLVLWLLDRREVTAN